MEFLALFSWIAVSVIWTAGGLLALLWADCRFPAAFERTCGDSLLGGIVCVLAWPWSLAVVLTLAWRDRRDARRYG